MGKHKQVFMHQDEKRTYEQLELQNKILCESNIQLKDEVDNLKAAVKALSSLIQELAR